MNAARWERVQELFHQALTRAPEQQGPFLDEACAGDAALRQEVEELLDSSSGAESLIGRAVASVARRGLDSLSSSPRPETLGPYRILEELGRGGHGTVYLAERDDSQFQMRVALKLIRRGLDTEDILRRFRQERQILASLDHPNIARILDGGTTAEGQPYFVMEHIEGLPIDRYCDRHFLPIDRRLDLFRQVCSAVQYTHQRLVIHRDLKPGNILVTPEGVPKLLDFGIAKILSPDALPMTEIHTAQGIRPLTPQYASPEQIRGEPLTTATDVYSLGLLLYRLLTGRPAYALEGLSTAEVGRAICELEPERPSTAFLQTSARAEGEESTPAHLSRLRSDQPERLSRRLAGDLDNITLMALRKEPARRYASAEQLSEDIRRHLKAQPIRARQDTLAYRMAKFYQRNKAVVFATAAVFLALVAGLATTLWQANVARELLRQVSRTQTDLERTSADLSKVVTFFTGIFEDSDPTETKGRSLTALEILAQATARVRSDLAGSPGIQARVRVVLATIFMNLEQYESAYTLLEEAQAGLADSPAAHALERAKIQNALGQYYYYKEGDSNKAALHFNQASVILRHETSRPSLEALEFSNNTATALSELGRATDAVEILHENIRLLEEEYPGDRDLTASTLGNLGSILAENPRIGRLRDAEELLTKSLEMAVRLNGEDSKYVANVQHNLAYLFASEDRPERAESLCRKALNTRREILGNDHIETLSTAKLLGSILRDRGKHEEALQLLKQALDDLTRAYGLNHQKRAYFLEQIGRIYYDREEYTKALNYFIEQKRINVESFGPHHEATARGQLLLGKCLMKLSREEESRTELRESCNTLQETSGLEDDWTRAACEGLDSIRTTRAKTNQANSTLRILGPSGKWLCRQPWPQGYDEQQASQSVPQLELLPRLTISKGLPCCQAEEKDISIYSWA